MTSGCPKCSRRLEALAAQAAARHQQGELLRSEIRAVMAQLPGRLSAKHVLRKLTGDPLPSIRRIQEIMKEIRDSDDAALAVRDIRSPSAFNTLNDN